jgi:hypothetical protein
MFSIHSGTVAFGHASTIGLEGGGKKWPNTTAPGVIENLSFPHKKMVFRAV